MAEKDDKAKIVKAFLAGRKILVADPGTTTRALLAKHLLELGAERQGVTLVPSFPAALEYAQTQKPGVIVADYELGAGSGLDLFEAVKQARHGTPDAALQVCILVTGNTSQSTVARAAEEEVDAFIIKPFTQEVLRNTLLQAISLKAQPPDYLKTITKGREQLEAKNIDGAITLFEEAKRMDTAPTLALGYLGQSHFIKESLEMSEQEFEQGLSLNKIHYKCLTGLFDVLMKRGQHKRAYEVIKRISQYFPANPKRLTQVLRLAIVTQSYEDVERYYRLFTGVEARSEEMIRYVCAALIVCGKHYLQTNSSSRAMEVFDRAATVAQERVRFHKEIVNTLCEAKLAKQAEDFLSKFPPAQRGTADYAIARIQVLATKGLAGQAIDLGRGLIKQGIKDVALFTILIKLSREAKLNSAADDLILQAKQAFPDQQAKFA